MIPGTGDFEVDAQLFQAFLNCDPSRWAAQQDIQGQFLDNALVTMPLLRVDFSTLDKAEVRKLLEDAWQSIWLKDAHYLCHALPSRNKTAVYMATRIRVAMLDTHSISRWLMQACHLNHMPQRVEVLRSHPSNFRKYRLHWIRYLLHTL